METNTEKQNTDATQQNKNVECIKNTENNKIMFFRNGKQIFDYTIKGNIVSFSNGYTILI
jgi:ribosomal protein L13